MATLADCRETGWFSGFADGEGCFRIVKYKSGSYGLAFSIRLRADDADILDRLKTCVGGNLSFLPVTETQKERRPGTNPQCTWCVASRSDVLKLISYFDRYPLQSKKAADYNIWRQAALLYYRYSVGSHMGKNSKWLGQVMQDYKTECAQLKQYQAKSADYNEEELEETQLILLEAEKCG